MIWVRLFIVCEDGRPYIPAQIRSNFMAVISSLLYRSHCTVRRACISWAFARWWRRTFVLIADACSASAALLQCSGCWRDDTILAKGECRHSASGATLRHRCLFGHFVQTQTSWKAAMWCWWSMSAGCSLSALLVCRCLPSVVVPWTLVECALQVAAVVTAVSSPTCECCHHSHRLSSVQPLASCATLPAPSGRHILVTWFQGEHWPQPSRSRSQSLSQTLQR